MSALGIATKALSNFQPTTSVLAGGAASLLTFAAGCVLVAAGISVPVLNIPITMTMVAGAAPVVGHLVTSLVPDSVNQHIAALAKKIQITAPELRAMIPQLDPTYPGSDGAAPQSVQAWKGTENGGGA